MRRYLLVVFLCVACGIVCLPGFFTAAGALEVDNLQDVYRIQVGEELALPEPSWSGGEDVEGNYAFRGNDLKTKGKDADGNTVVWAETAGVYPLEAWVEADGRSELKWIAVVVEDAEGTVPPPALGDWMSYFGRDNYEWSYGIPDRTLNVPAYASCDCTFRIEGYRAFYQAYGDCPEWTVTQISGPEFRYTQKREDWIEDEEGRQVPYGCFDLYFDAEDQNGDAVYEVAVSWHGTRVAQRLTVHPVIPEKWELQYDNHAAETIEPNFYAGTDDSISLQLYGYSYFKNQLGEDPVLQLRKVSGLDLDWQVSSYTANSGSEFWFNPGVIDLPAAAGDSVYDAVCSWGGRTQTVRVHVHVIIPEMGIPTGITRMDPIVLEVGEKWQIRMGDYEIQPAGWGMEGYEVYRDWGINDGDGVIEAEETGDVITLTALDPGYASFSMYVYCGNYTFEDSITVTVTENGVAPEMQDMILIPSWPRTAVPGDSAEANFSWWNEVPPATWRMEVEHNGEKTVFTRKSSSHLVSFTEKGTYVLHCYLTDGKGRKAEATATTTVADPGPLQLGGVHITATNEIGKDSHDVWLRTDYSGGYHAATLHYKIFAKDTAGAWYMTWEQDGEPDQYFWIGEDGEHYFEVSVTDGVSRETAVTETVRLGQGTPEARYILDLPDDLEEVGEGAFAGNGSIEKVIFGDRVRRIGPDAFADCANLKEAVIPSSVTSIDDDAFRNVENLLILSDSEDSAAAEFAERKNYIFQIGTRYD